MKKTICSVLPALSFFSLSAIATESILEPYVYPLEEERQMEVCHQSTITDAWIELVDEDHNPTGEIIRFQDLSYFPGCMTYNRPFNGEPEYWLYSFMLDNMAQTDSNSIFTNRPDCGQQISFNRYGQAYAAAADIRCPLYWPPDKSNPTV